MGRLNLLSIIIVNYNSGSTLQEAISSVINQSTKNYELIIIDGNSTDNSKRIIEENQEFINQCISEPDKGIYDAMNKGIRMAKGKWVYFLGADDVFYDNNVLKRISRTLSITRADIVYGNVIKTPSKVKYDGRFNVFKMNYKNICHQAIFYRKTVFDKVGLFDIQYPVNADWEFNFKAMLNKKIRFKYSHEIIACFNETGISGTKNDSAYEIRRKDFIKQLPVWAKICFRFRKTTVIKLVSKYLLNYAYA